MFSMISMAMISMPISNAARNDERLINKSIKDFF